MICELSLGARFGAQPFKILDRRFGKHDLPLINLRAQGLEGDQETLRVAAAEAPSIIQIGPDTFTWADRRYDVTWGGLMCRLLSGSGS